LPVLLYRKLKKKKLRKHKPGLREGEKSKRDLTVPMRESLTGFRVSQGATEMTFIDIKTKERPR